MKVLVIGKHGQLCKSINKVITNTKQENEYIFTGTEDLDLSKETNNNSYFNYNIFDAIINCAAYTKVEKAEENFVLANQINNIANAYKNAGKDSINGFKKILLNLLSKTSKTILRNKI